MSYNLDAQRRALMSLTPAPLSGQAKEKAEERLALTPCSHYSLTTMKDEELIEVLWSISLSDHLGDVAEAIAPILKKFGLPVMSLPALYEELKKRDLRPDYAREGD